MVAAYWPADAAGGVVRSWMGLNMADGRQARAGQSGSDRPDGTNVIPPGVRVDDSDEDDPVLRNAAGSQVDTWREDYPYTERMPGKKTDHLKPGLKFDLLKLKNWSRILASV